MQLYHLICIIKTSIFFMMKYRPCTLPHVRSTKPTCHAYTFLCYCYTVPALLTSVVFIAHQQQLYPAGFLLPGIKQEEDLLGIRAKLCALIDTMSTYIQYHRPRVHQLRPPLAFVVFAEQSGITVCL